MLAEADDARMTSRTFSTWIAILQQTAVFCYLIHGHANARVGIMRPTRFAYERTRKYLCPAAFLLLAYVF